jgi:hypothetical protein
MVRAFFDDALSQGTLNFDTIIAKCLSVVLVSSLGCRGGDVMRSREYHGTEYLQYQHIELTLDAGMEPAFENLRAIITLDYTKGSKLTRNKSVVKYLRPLDDVQFIHVCPIALLLIHALRHGLVYGTTIEEVLNHTAAQTDLQVKWTRPDLPVLPAFSSDGIRCELDHVAPTKQLNNTVRDMGVVAGLLSRAHAHALRLGAIRDFAHTVKTTSNPNADEVRAFAGHSHGAMTKGVTEQYIGDVFREDYNDRAIGGGVRHRREPAFALDTGALSKLKNQPISTDEIQADISKHFPGKDSSSLTAREKNIMVRRVRRERIADAPKSVESAPKSNLNMALLSAPANPPPVQMKRIKKMSVGVLLGSSESAVHSSLPSSGDKDDDILSRIDPALLNSETLDSIPVADSDVSALQSIIMYDASQEENLANPNTEDHAASVDVDINDIANDTNNNEEEAICILLGQEPDNDTNSSASELMPAVAHCNEWINSYAKYNVVRNKGFATAYTKVSGELSDMPAETMSLYASVGNSRDEPSLYVFHCQRTEGCTYQSYFFGHKDRHELTCNISSVKKSFNSATLCSYDGCTYTTTCGPDALQKHVRLAHTFTPKACKHSGCDPDKTYDTGYKWNKHQQLHNSSSSNWPTQCRVPDCPDTKAHQRNGYLTHLLKIHGLVTEEARSPYMPPTLERTSWARRKCSQPRCASKKTYRHPSEFRKHLIKAHGMTEEDANNLVESLLPTTIDVQGNAGEGAKDSVSSIAPGNVRGSGEEDTTAAPKSKRARTKK